MFDMCALVGAMLRESDDGYIVLEYFFASVVHYKVLEIL